MVIHLGRRLSISLPGSLRLDESVSRGPAARQGRSCGGRASVPGWERSLGLPGLDARGPGVRNELTVGQRVGVSGVLQQAVEQQPAGARVTAGLTGSRTHLGETARAQVRHDLVGAQ